MFDGLTEKDPGRDPLAEMQRIINAERIALFDLVAYVEYVFASTHLRGTACAQAGFPLRSPCFFAFVIAHFVTLDVEESNLQKLAPQLRFK